MKKLAIAFLLLLDVAFSGISQEQVLKPSVDERTELLGVVFRLAGAQEYVNNNLLEYSGDIDQYFKAFIDHPMIKYARQIRGTNGISYDAVMNMAVHISITDSIRFKENLSGKSLDKRWGTEIPEKFLDLLNQFYAETKFNAFFTDHSTIRSVAENNFNAIISQVDFPWFQQYYGGTPRGGFNLIISLTNGGGNYGVKVLYGNGQEDIYAIIGSWQQDNLGQPVYSNSITPTIIHEYNHSFCNPLIDEYSTQMEAQAGKMYNLVSGKLRQQAYGTPKTMLYEILVRACVIRYQQNHGFTGDQIGRLIIAEQNRGFLWIGQLVDLLSVYEKERSSYAALLDFMPEIVKLQNSLDAKRLTKKFDKHCARIISTSIKNGSLAVDPSINQIVVRFDRPMNTGSHGSTYGKRGKELFPEIPKDRTARWNKETKKEWILPVSLKPETEYSISFPANFFMAENLYPLRETLFLDFKTGKKLGN